MAYLFDNPLRPLIHDPKRILGTYVKPGMTVLDIGCGMGFFSLGMARMVGPEGKVISLDLQARMLEILEKRALKRVSRPVDFALCFWMVHEVPDQVQFFRELARTLKPGAHVLIAEPGMRHVKREDLEETVHIAAGAGFSVTHRPKIRMSHAVVLKKIEQ
jgi:ubiquinone/menaquinone biosynthesis C-methylase UbiE